ncbi:MAG: type II toxin-antitoxin system RelE/ParE family toxin [Flavobacteriales bacterium]|nr:type II toxin-antitoxin system RelE/ParE family toxin [Flavobacteriales bacterium]
MIVVVAEKAWSDLDRALAHVLDRFGPATAMRVEQDVIAAIKLIQKFPNGGQLEPWLEHLGMQHRRVIVGPLKIIYRIHGKTIYIPEIFDSRRDPDDMKG